MNVDQAYLFAFGYQVIHGFLGSFCAGTHHNDDSVGIGSAIVVEQMVAAAGEFVDFLHVVFYSIRNGSHSLVAGFPALEEDIRVYGGAAGSRMFRVQSVFAEGPDGIVVYQRPQVFVIQSINLLDFVGSTEPIKEMQHRHPAVDGSQVGNSPQVHNLLRRRRCQHGKARVPDGHYVGVVTENGKGMGGKGTGGNMEHARQHFASDLVHIGDHQEQALRCGVGGGQGTGL